jgi:STE24 endopeptidase
MNTLALGSPSVPRQFRWAGKGTRKDFFCAGRPAAKLSLLLFLAMWVDSDGLLGAQKAATPSSAASPTTTEAATPATTQTNPAESPTAASTEARITEYVPAPENYQTSVAYSSAHYRHFFLNTLYGWLILLMVLRFHLAPTLRSWAERVSSRRFVQVILFAPAFLLTIAVLNLHSDLWDHSLDRRFGLSVEGWGSWFTDWLSNQLLVTIVATLLVWILYGVIRRSPRRWWFYFWTASIPVILAVFFVQPVVIDPLFFKFTPLETRHPELVAQLQQVVRHGGIEIPAERMFEMNASSKLTGLNAYVTGFGPSKRAVVWDTTLAKATVPETLFVFGHEMGHYVLFHIPKEISIFALMLLALFYLGFRISHWALARWGKSWKIPSLDDWASLPLLLLLLNLLVFLATPAVNSVSRYFEHEADRFGLEVIHGIVADPGQVAAHYFQKSGQINLADPKPSTFAKIWFFDHPTRPERVRFAANYNPWIAGASPVYVH